MRIVALIGVLIAALLAGSCTIIQKEMTNRGGYLDYVLDQHWFKADSKRMRALRAFAIQVSLARVASVSAKNETARQLLALRIGALTQLFNKTIYACALLDNPLNVPGAEKDPCFYYDSAMVEYSTGLFDLAMVALPVDDAKNLVNAVTGSISAPNPVAFGTLLNALLVIGRDALTYGRIVGGLYRDTIELEVQLWIWTPQIDHRPAPYQVTDADVAALRAIYAGGNDDMPAWISAIATLRSQGLEPLPDPKFFAELNGLMNYICDLITKDQTVNPKVPATPPATSCKTTLPSVVATPAAANGGFPLRVSTTSGMPVVAAPRVQVPNPAPAVSNPAPVVSNPAPVANEIGTDPERTLLMTYLHVGPKASQNLMQLVALPAIHAEILQDQGTGAGTIPPLPIIVDTVKYAPARKLIVQAGCQQGLFQKVANATVAGACKP